MSPKAVLGKTKQYSGLAANVSKNTKPQEPTLTPQEIGNTFRSFGFQPNQTNNDISYWSTQPVSAKNKLISELKKRRDDENSKKVAPRLNDKQIASLFDEYGLPTPDFNWVRGHLPNDPEKLRSVLEIQRNAMNDMLKAHTKNMTKSMAQTNTPQLPQSIMNPMNNGMANMGGMGGPGIPTSAGTPDPNTAGYTPGPSMGGSSEPFFIGDSTIVKILNAMNPNASTLWLVDPKNKTMRPFMSEQAFDASFQDPEQAKRAITIVTPQDLGQGGVLSGFQMLNGQYGIQDDGSMQNIEFSPSQLAQKYGQQSNPGIENKSLSLLDGVLDKVSGQSPQGTPSMSDNMMASDPASQSAQPQAPQPTTPQNAPMSVPTNVGSGGPGYGMGGPGDSPTYGVTYDPHAESTASQYVNDTLSSAPNLDVDKNNNTQIDPSFISQIKNDPQRMALYINALAYGGYTVGDILNDVKRLQAVAGGDQQASSVQFISSTIPKTQYAASSAGQNANSYIPTLFPKGTQVSNIDSQMLQYGIYNMPDQFFKNIVPVPTMSDISTAADSIKSALHDVTVQQLNASNDQEKAIADYNYQTLQKEVQDVYGLRLSDSVTQAWNQIDNMQTSSAQRGIQGSGMETDQVDSYLRGVRQQEASTRSQELTTQQQQEANFYKTSASPDQIQTLIAQDQASGKPQDQWKSVLYGLVPSDDVKNALTIDKIKGLQPGLTDQQAQDYYNSIFDQNGNYRSTLFQKYYQSQYQNQQSYQSYQKTTAENQIANKTDQAERTYTNDPNYQFSGTPAGQDASKPQPNAGYFGTNNNAQDTGYLNSQTAPKTTGTNNGLTYTPMSSGSNTGSSTSNGINSGIVSSAVGNIVKKLNQDQNPSPSSTGSTSQPKVATGISQGLNYTPATTTPATTTPATTDTSTQQANTKPTTTQPTTANGYLSGLATNIAGKVNSWFGW